MPSVYAVDWAYRESKLAVYDGRRILKNIPKLQAGDIIVTENIPERLAQQAWEAGAKVLRCQPRDTAEMRKAEGKLKTDEGDALLIWRLYHEHPGLFREMSPSPPLAALYTTFKEVQKLRVATGNRVFAKQESAMAEITAMLKRIEDRMSQEIAKELKHYTIWTDWMSKVKGVGPLIGGGLVTSLSEESSHSPPRQPCGHIPA